MSDTVDEEIVNAIMAEENHNKTATYARDRRPRYTVRAAEMSQ